MFGSTVLDVATGLIFVFLAVSLAASAVTEALSSLVKLRQRTLLSGVQALLNDGTTGGLVRDIYNHALVNPLSNGQAAGAVPWSAVTKPAYIDAGAFATALVGALEARGGSGGAGPKPLKDLLGEIADPQLRQALLELLARASDDRDRFLAEVGRWFDDAMDRLGGWYKRYTQVIGFAVALLVAGLLNADALRVGAVLWQRPTLVAELRAAVPSPDVAPNPPGGRGETAAQDAIAALDRTGMLGWRGTAPDGAGAVLSMLLGWLIVAGASLFGAPFWFDLLQRVAQVAGVGPDGSGAGRRAGAAGPDAAADGLR